MFTTKKYLKLLSLSESELDKSISKMSEKDAKEFVKIVIRYMQNPNTDTFDTHN